MASVTVERKYALTKVASGDYLLPSNDGQTLWRVSRYEDGPSHGLDGDGWTHDLMFWGIWVWPGPMPRDFDESCLDFSHWEMREGFHETRAQAINAALRVS